LPALQPALQRNNFDKLFGPDDILARLVDNRWQAWILEDEGHRIRTAALTEIFHYPRCKTCRVWVVSGQGFGLWGDWWAIVEAWARLNRCTRMEGGGRKGWERRMAKNGLMPEGVMYSKGL
jgi:hypothetical protein